MMVEVAGNERNVDVASLADRLAVIDRLQDRRKRSRFWTWRASA